jgi:hypothetical protein
VTNSLTLALAPILAGMLTPSRRVPKRVVGDGKSQTNRTMGSKRRASLAHITVVTARETWRRVCSASILLALLFHTVLPGCDEPSALRRQVVVRRQTLGDARRALTR